MLLLGARVPGDPSRLGPLDPAPHRATAFCHIPASIRPGTRTGPRPGPEKGELSPSAASSGSYRPGVGYCVSTWASPIRIDNGSVVRSNSMVPDWPPPLHSTTQWLVAVTW